MAYSDVCNIRKRALKRVDLKLSSLETEMPGNSGIELAQDNDVAHCTADSSHYNMGMSEEEYFSSEVGTDESSDDEKYSHPSLASVLSDWCLFSCPFSAAVHSQGLPS